MFRISGLTFAFSLLNFLILFQLLHKWDVHATCDGRDRCERGTFLKEMRQATRKAICMD